MAVKKKTIDEATLGEISEIFKKLKDKGLIFRCDLPQISKHLLKEFLPVNPFSVDFETLLQSFLKQVKSDGEIDEEEEIVQIIQSKTKKELDEATATENDFHRYICKTYFDLAKEPRLMLLEAYDKAKKEILQFIKRDIKDYALTKSYDNSLWGSLLIPIPYNYSWNPRSYKPQLPNDLENKLEDLAYKDFMKVYNQYKENKSAFYDYLTKYITDNDIVFLVNDLLNKHHILDERKEIIKETLDIYQNGSKIMFAMAVPSIIEGIFHDLCILIGEKENNLLKEGFQYKLDKLHGYLGTEMHYEYYSFRFRLFRNKVSHGRLSKTDVDELADLLLLDLYQICRLVYSDRLDMNHKRHVIDELNKNLVKPDWIY